MFHPFSSLNFALLKSMQVQPVLYFTAKMGATSVKKSSTGNMITITFLENISLHLRLNAGLIGSLPIADNAIQLGFAVKYLFEFHYMLCNQSSRSFNNWSFCDHSIWFLLHLTWDYFDSSDWRICLLLVGRIYLFCWSIQYFYRIYLLWRRSTCNIIVIILPWSITCIPANKPVVLHRYRSSELCCIPEIDHRTYFFESSFAFVILVLIVVLGSG